MTPRWVRGACAVLALVAGGCGGDGSGATGAFTPSHPHRMVVATAFLGSPGFWEVDGDGAPTGFEAGLAEALATRLDLDGIDVVEVPFADLVAGDLGDADVAISQLTPTSEREGSLDFTGPYVRASPGVLVRAEVEADDLFALRGLRWVVLRGSTLASVVADQVNPSADPQIVSTRGDALDRLRRDEADAMLLDLPVALATARAEPDGLAVVGQLSDPEDLAVAVPDGSPNLHAVDTAVRALVADGTVDDLAEEWLGARIADGADSVPLIRTR